MSDLSATRARELMLDWAEGRKTHEPPPSAFRRGDLSEVEMFAEEQMYAVQDAQEVVKWAAVYRALRDEDS